MLKAEQNLANSSKRHIACSVSGAVDNRNRDENENIPRKLTRQGKMIRKKTQFPIPSNAGTVMIIVDKARKERRQ
jgi:hypothetical protein